MRRKPTWKASLTGERTVRARTPVLRGDVLLASWSFEKGPFYRSVLRKLDPLTGEPRWDYTIDHVGNRPAIAPDGSIYWGSFDGNVHALGTDGVLRWKAPDTGTNTWSPALLEGDRLAFCEIAGGSRRTWCLDAKTGEVRWTFENGGHSSGLATSGRLLLHATSLAGGAIGDPPRVVLYCLDSDTGTPVWAVPSDRHHREPLVLDGVVYIGAGGDFRAYALSDGRLLTTLLGVTASCTPLAWRNRLYVGDAEGRVRCLSALDRFGPSGPTLAVVWEAQLPAGTEATPVPVGSLLALLAEDGMVHLLDPETGHTVETIRVSKGKDIGGLASEGSRLFVAHRKELTCFTIA